MKTTRQSQGKISEHFEGLGTVTRDAVEQRARELALINGRGPNHYSQEDFDQAKRELTGADLEGQAESEEVPVENLVAWDEPPTAAGRPAAKEEALDEQSYAEQLVEEGMDEAEHDRMIEGARDPHNQE